MPRTDTLIAGAITDLERPRADLRAAVLLAGQEIRKLNFGRADSRVLGVLRRVLREARAVARKKTAGRSHPTVALLRDRGHRCHIRRSGRVPPPAKMRCQCH